MSEELSKGMGTEEELSKGMGTEPPMKADVGTDELLRVAQANVASINGLSRQMGVANARLDEHEKMLSRLDRRVTVREQREILNSAQRRQMRKAVIRRVNSVLEIRFEGGKVSDESVADEVRYRGGFISRLYADAKNHSKMGESYGDTLAVDYDAVMKYIGNWYPEVEGGTEGYKRYLDIRHEERRKAREAETA